MSFPPGPPLPMPGIPQVPQMMPPPYAVPPMGASPTQPSISSRPAVFQNNNNTPSKRKVTVDDVFLGNEKATKLKKKRSFHLDDNQDEGPKSPNSVSQMTIEERKSYLIKFVQNIPREMEKLFSYNVDWTLVDKVLMESRLRPWINQELMIYGRSVEPAFVDIICSKIMAGSAAQSILDDVSMMLGEAAKNFVCSLWMQLIYGIELKKMGVVLALSTTPGAATSEISSPVQVMHQPEKMQNSEFHSLKPHIDYKRLRKNGGEEEKEKNKDGRRTRRRDYESPEPRSRDIERERDRDRDKRWSKERSLGREERSLGREERNSRRCRSRESEHKSPRYPVVSKEHRERSRDLQIKERLKRFGSRARNEWNRERECPDDNKAKEKESDKDEEDAYKRKKQEKKIREKEAVYQKSTTPGAATSALQSSRQAPASEKSRCNRSKDVHHIASTRFPSNHYSSVKYRPRHSYSSTKPCNYKNQRSVLEISPSCSPPAAHVCPYYDSYGICSAENCRNGHISRENTKWLVLKHLLSTNEMKFYDQSQILFEELLMKILDAVKQFGTVSNFVPICNRRQHLIRNIYVEYKHQYSVNNLQSVNTQEHFGKHVVILKCSMFMVSNICKTLRCKFGEIACNKIHVCMLSDNFNKQIKE